MKIHEYQASQIMLQFGVKKARGEAVETTDQAEALARSLGKFPLVVKAQVHAGGRGKGHFKNGFQGGVHLAHSVEEVKEFSKKMLNEVLVTPQTGEEGILVRKLFICEAMDIDKELYLAFLLDRTTSETALVFSTCGGVDIEKVAKETPHLVLKEKIPVLSGLLPYQARKVAQRLGMKGKLITKTASLLLRLYQIFIQRDCSLLEINPLAISPEEEVYPIDVKMNFDENAIYRQEKVASYRDTLEEDPREVRASKFNLSYIGLEGDIACMVNGAGLAMATMDIIKFYGGEPANFLDVGGGANEEQVTEAFKILCEDKKVKAILVNIFGGIMQCDIIAKGIIHALKSVELSVPIVVRLEGTNVELGRKILTDSRLPIISGENLGDAAKKVVALSKKS